jgi:hypothetical protein
VQVNVSVIAPGRKKGEEGKKKEEKKITGVSCAELYCREDLTHCM